MTVSLSSPVTVYTNRVEQRAVVPSEFCYKKVLTINSGPLGIKKGHTATAPFETHPLIACRKIRQDRRDVKLSFRENEIDWHIDILDGRFRFRIQEDILPNTACSDYIIYYGNPNILEQPFNNPRYIFPFYSDAGTLDDFAIQGTAPTLKDVPKPRLIKHKNPITEPSYIKGTFDYDLTRDAQYFYDDADDTHYVFYDAGDGVKWLTSVLSSKDMINWTKHGPVLQLDDGWGKHTCSGATVGKHFYDGRWQYYLYYLIAQGNNDSVPGSYYLTALAKADHPLGRWVKHSPTSEPILIRHTDDTDTDYLPEYRNIIASATIPCIKQKPDGTLEGLMAGWGRLHKISAPRPEGPWLIEENIYPDFAFEGAQYTFDEQHGVYYLITNHIIQGDGVAGRHTETADLWWTNDIYNWQEENKVSIMFPTQGHHDGGLIGCPYGPWFYKDSWYIAYDGRLNLINNGWTERLYWDHFERVVLMADINFPMTWGKRIKPEDSETNELKLPINFGDGSIEVTARFKNTRTAAINVGNSMMFVDDGTDIKVRTIGATIQEKVLVLKNDDGVTGKVWQRHRTDFIQYKIRRDGKTVEYLINNKVQATHTDAPTSQLSLSIQGAVEIESIVVTTDSYVDTSMSDEIPIVSKIEISPSYYVIEPGGTVELSATAYSTSGTQVDSSFEWSVDDPAKASITQSGLLTMIGIGDITVSAESQGIKGTALVTTNLQDPEFPELLPKLTKINDLLQITVRITNLTTWDRVVIEQGVVPEGQTSKVWSFFADAELSSGTFRDGIWKADVRASLLLGDYFFRCKVVR